MYFKVFISKSGDKRATGSRRRFNHRFLLGEVGRRKAARRGRCFDDPSVSLTADSSLYTREPWRGAYDRVFLTVSKAHGPPPWAFVIAAAVDAYPAMGGMNFQGMSNDPESLFTTFVSSCRITP